jgi:hypothetical protein
MALINPIGGDAHVDEWRAALQQYFKIVRVFDALAAPFEERLQLLRAVGQLRDEWRRPLEAAVAALEEERRRLHRSVARAVAAMLVDMLAHSESRRLSDESDPLLFQPTLEQQYKDALRAREREGRRDVEHAYGHRRIERSEGPVELLDQDLFSTDHWFFWGLNRRQLVATGAASGALVGGAVDVGVGGASLLLGTLVGATLGGATAWLSRRRLSLPLGGRLLRCGPTRDVNFPYVVLGRALYHHARIAGRTHANRGPLELAGHEDAPNWIDRLPRERRGALERLFRRLREEEGGPEVTEELAALLVPILAEADAAPGVAA